MGVRVAFGVRTLYTAAVCLSTVRDATAASCVAERRVQISCGSVAPAVGGCGARSDAARPHAVCADSIDWTAFEMPSGNCEVFLV